MAVKQIKSFDEFKTTINKGMTFVDFFASWCGPCKMLAPIIDEVSEKIKDVNFVKVDIDQVREVTQTFNIQSIPTIILFKDGKPVNTFLGYRPKEQVLQFIKEKK